MISPRLLKAGLLLAIFVGLGYRFTGDLRGNYREYEKKANEVVALAQLKKYSVAQGLVSVEFGEYARRLDELYREAAYEGLISQTLLDALHDSESPVPLSGYLFADVEEDEYGSPLDEGWRCGFSAFPAEPGSTGDHVLLILFDDRAAPEPQGPVGHGTWKLFSAHVERVRGPVTRWPTERELRTKFVEIRSPTPPR